MFYRYALLVPADTPENTPVEQEIKLPPGIIHQVIVKFPPGCHQRVYFAVYQGASKIIPLSPDRLDKTMNYPTAALRAQQRLAMRGYLCGDGEEIAFREHVVNKHGYHWKMVGFSPDTLYNHIITVRFGILKEEEISPFTIVKDLVAIFKRMMGLR